MITAHCPKRTENLEHGSYSRTDWDTCPRCKMERMARNSTLFTYGVVCVISASAVIGLVRAFS
jgi:hypothetical protein